MAIKPLPTDQSAYVGTDGKPAIVFYTWLKSLADVLNTLLSTFFVGGTASFAWTDFVATIAPGSGSITAYTANGRFTQLGKIVFLQLEIDITNNGTGGGGIILVTLPPALPVPFAGINAIHGHEDTNNIAVFGQLFSGLAMSTRNYDGSYPGFSGAVLVFNGAYEAA